MKIMLDEGAYMPTRAHATDAGYDLRTPEAVVVPAHSNAVVDTGVHVQIPAGYTGFLKSKSGLNVKYGIEGEGVVDAGYSGSIVVKLYNHSDKNYMFAPGDKLIQIVFLPIYAPDLEQTDHFEETERGDQGFGSSGR